MSTLAANLVLEYTVERIFVGDMYGDVPLGLYIVRGENVVLVGQIVRRAGKNKQTHAHTHIYIHRCPSDSIVSIRAQCVEVEARCLHI